MKMKQPTSTKKVESIVIAPFGAQLWTAVVTLDTSEVVLQEKSFNRRTVEKRAVKFATKHYDTSDYMLIHKNR